MTPAAAERSPPRSAVRRAGVLGETATATAIAFYLALRLQTSLAWLLLGLCLIFAGRRPLSRYGLDLRLRPPPLHVHAILGASLLFLYGAGHAALSAFRWHQTFALRLSANPLADLARELLIVAFPEEVFFRGYVQSRWDLVWGKRWRLFGASIGPGLIAQAGLFAICHLASGDWWRLSVFFFGLLAGWLRARSGSVLGPIAYHAGANLWVRTLSASFH